MTIQLSLSSRVPFRSGNISGSYSLLVLCNTNTLQSINMEESAGKNCLLEAAGRKVKRIGNIFKHQWSPQCSLTLFGSRYFITQITSSVLVKWVQLPIYIQQLPLPMLVGVYTEYKVLATFTSTDVTYICNQATELREHQEHHSLSWSYLYFLLTAVSVPKVLSY